MGVVSSVEAKDARFLEFILPHLAVRLTHDFYFYEALNSEEMPLEDKIEATDKIILATFEAYKDSEATGFELPVYGAVA